MRSNREFSDPKQGNKCGNRQAKSVWPAPLLPAPMPFTRPRYAGVQARSRSEPAAHRRPRYGCCACETIQATDAGGTDRQRAGTPGRSATPRSGCLVCRSRLEACPVYCVGNIVVVATFDRLRLTRVGMLGREPMAERFLVHEARAPRAAATHAIMIGAGGYPRRLGGLAIRDRINPGNANPRQPSTTS